ncbi:MAG: xylan 1,4-beta-xylosidase [Proteobacteria bacterium]|nr:xylan 1,4-beta-xylosidase [Pseudomonadota bacterium]
MSLIAKPKLISVLVAGTVAGGSLMLVACGGGGDDSPVAVIDQPVLSARSKSIITVESKQFKDLNADGKLDKYEDWRLSVDERIDDLVSKMNDTEKVGMLMINDNNAGCGGSVTSTAVDYINNQKMTRFILRSTAAATAEACGAAPANSRGGYVVTPQQLATYTNSVQEMAEATRLGIPVVFKDNARNHVETDPRQGISAGAGAFTQFPKEAGLAAAALGEESLKTGKEPTVGDMSVISEFTKVMGPEYNAVGLRGLYGYMADLLTEPRWYRAHEVYTENADLNANIMKALVEGLQGTTIKDGTSVNSKSALAMTMKHFPGAGPQELGMDAHYSYGKYQQYDGATNFDMHLKPFKAAIAAGVSAIMPYYAIAMTGRDANKQPIPLTYEGTTFPMTGFSFSKDMVTGLLRDKLGFKGYVNTDTGIVTFTPWGMEWKDESTRIATAVNAGADTLSGYATNSKIKALVDSGLITQARLNQAVKSLLKEQFQLGLFENPYVDVSKANSVIGTQASRDKAVEIQKKSVVLLQNQTQSDGSKVLPLKAGAKVYTIGFGKTDVEKYGYTVTDGNYTAGTTTRPSAAGNDVAIIRVLVKDKTMPFNCDTYATSGPINPLTGTFWGAEDPKIMAPVGATNPATGETGPAINATCSLTLVGNVLGFGGALPWEIGDISFTGMSTATSRTMYPTLDDIKNIMTEIGDPKKVVLSVYFRAPYVLDDASGMKNAGAILATFGVTDTSMLEVLSGKFKPQGKLPFALPKTQAAVDQQKSDLPGFDETTDGALYKFGFGLTY